MDQGKDWGYGISINFHKKDLKKSHKSMTDKSAVSDTVYLFDCMVYAKMKKGVPAPEPVPLSD